VLEVAERGAVAVLSVRLQSERELAGEVGELGNWGATPGLEVVWWQKVEPVGGMA
jgi:hypothetical protein